jgi:RimJ/RimL family protein N-acetyltransferase
VIETERLTLRPLSESDFEAWADFLGDPEATRLLHTPEPITDPERARSGLSRWIAMAEGEIGMYTVIVRDSGETAGFVGFVPRDHPWGHELELGWLLRPPYWGKGYATEAARALRPLVDDRVVSMIRVENDASANVARKLGMTIEREVDDYHGYATHVWVSHRSGSPGSGAASG